MKVYISESNGEYPPIKGNYEIVSDFEKSDVVLVLPGGIEAFYDLFRTVKLKKEAILYNKDNYYQGFIKQIAISHINGKIKTPPSLYMTIENDWEEIERRLEEKEYEKINNGKTSKLL